MRFRGASCRFLICGLVSVVVAVVLIHSLYTASSWETLPARLSLHHQPAPDRSWSLGNKPWTTADGAVAEEGDDSKNHNYPDRSSGKKRPISHAEVFAIVDTWWDSMMCNPRLPKALLYSGNDPRGLGGQIYELVALVNLALVLNRSPVYASGDFFNYDVSQCDDVGEKGLLCYFEPISGCQSSVSVTQSNLESAMALTTSILRSSPGDGAIVRPQKFFLDADQYRSVDLAFPVVSFRWNFQPRTITALPHRDFNLATPSVLRSLGWSGQQWSGFILSKLIKPRPWLKDIVSASMSALEWDPRCIAVHIRRADKNVEIGGSVPGVHLYLDRVEEVMRLHGKEVGAIFLTTDSPDVAAEFQSGLAERGIRRRFMYNYNQTRYNGKECEGIANGDCFARRGLVGNEQSDWAIKSAVDLMLLSSCDFLVGDVRSYFTSTAGKIMVGRPEFRQDSLSWQKRVHAISESGSSKDDVPSAVVNLDDLALKLAVGLEISLLSEK